MKELLKSKLVLSLAAFLMVATAIFIPLSGSITRSHAQGASDVSFTKSATPTVAPGGTIKYTLTLTNTTPTGSGNLHDIHLTDTPPSQTTGSFTAPTFTITPAGSATVDCTSSTPTSISCFVDDFQPGSVVTVTFSATASSTATGTITDTATAESLTIGTVTASANTVIPGTPTPTPTPTTTTTKTCTTTTENGVLVQTCTTCTITTVNGSTTKTCTTTKEQQPPFFCIGGESCLGKSIDRTQQPSKPREEQPIAQQVILCGLDLLDILHVGPAFKVFGHTFKVFEVINKGTHGFLFMRDVTSGKPVDAIVSFIPGIDCAELTLRAFPEESREFFDVLVRGSVQAAIDAICAQRDLFIPPNNPEIENALCGSGK